MVYSEFSRGLEVQAQDEKLMREPVTGTFVGGWTKHDPYTFVGCRP